jgi:hypothetical protein
VTLAAVLPARATPSLSVNECDGPVPPSWRLLDDVAVMTLPDPVFLVNGMIHDLGIGVLYSPPGTGKTTAIAALAVAIATGGRFFGHQVLAPGPVVYVGAEDPSGFKVRLRAAKVAAGLRLEVPIGVYTFPEAVDLGDAASVECFERFLKAQHFEMPLKMVIVDTYAASTPGANENSAEDTTTAMAHAMSWRQALNCAVMLAHHTNATGTRERGHSAMRGACDFMISMTPLDDLILMECSKIRNGSPFKKVTLKLVPPPDDLPGMVLKLASDVLPSMELTDNERKALDALRDTFREAEGATKVEWLTACGGMSPSTYYRVAKTLEEKGCITQVGKKLRIVPSAGMP